MHDPQLQALMRTGSDFTKRKPVPALSDDATEACNNSSSYLVFDHDGIHESHSVYVNSLKATPSSATAAMNLASPFDHTARRYTRVSPGREISASHKQASSDVAERIQARQLEKFASFRQSFDLDSMDAGMECGEARPRHRPVEEHALFNGQGADTDANEADDQELHLETHRILQLSNESSRADFPMTTSGLIRSASTSSRTSSRKTSWDSHTLQPRNSVFKPDMMVSAPGPFIETWHKPALPASGS